MNDIKVAEMETRFDANTAQEAETALTKLVDGGSRKIVCDMSKTEFISSAGLRVLLSVAKQLQKLNGKIILCSLKPPVQKVFEMAGFTRIFETYGSEEEALKSLK